MKLINKLVYFECGTELPLQLDEAMYPACTELFNDVNNCWGYIFEPVFESEEDIQQIMTLKRLHEKGYRTFAVLILTPYNLMECFGYFRALSLYCDLIQFTQYTQARVPFFEEIFIPSLLKDSTTRLFITDDLLETMSMQRAQLPAYCVQPGEALFVEKRVEDDFLFS